MRTPKTAMTTKSSIKEKAQRIMLLVAFISLLLDTKEACRLGAEAAELWRVEIRAALIDERVFPPLLVR
jgi:hypothetical protein